MWSSTIYVKYDLAQKIFWRGKGIKLIIFMNIMQILCILYVILRIILFQKFYSKIKKKKNHILLSPPQ